MTRGGPQKPVVPEHWQGRRDNARAYHKAARDGLALAERGANANPVMSSIVLAAVAYADALTARYRGTVNQKDHAALVRALRAALGNRFPAAQERRLRSILDAKDEVQYGIRLGRTGEAELMLKELDDFARWVEQELVR